MTIAVVNDNGDLQAYIGTLAASTAKWLSWKSDEGFPAADAAIVWQAPDTWLQQLPIPALVAETSRTLHQMGCASQPIGRFCPWPTFLQRKRWEVAANSHRAAVFAPLAAALQIEILAIEDIPGLIAPRIISSIINEAYYGLAIELCSPTDMDTAMQLGTNYPYGPLQWLQMIGATNVVQLLSVLSEADSRYQPHPMLQAEVAA